MKKKSFLVLLAFALLFFGCHQELDLMNQEDQTNVDNFNKDNVKTRILNKTDFENTEFLKTDIGMVSGFLKNQKSGNTSSQSKQIISGYEVYTNTFEEVSYLNAKYHSFYIIGDESDGYEEKLVVKSINDQITEQHILRYKRKQDFSIDPASYQTLKLQSNPDKSSKIMFIDTFSMGCSTYTAVSYECGYTGHHTNGQYCSVLGVNMPYNTVSVIFEAGCTGSSHTGGGVGGGDDGGGGGGSPNAPYTPPVLTIPTSAPLYTTHGPKGTTCNSLGLNVSEIDQINSDQSLRLKIYQYIAVSESIYPLPCENDFFSDEYKTFIKAIIKYVSESGTPANDLTFDYLNSAYQFFQGEYSDMTEPENFFHRLKALDNALAQNPNLLLDIPCGELGDWNIVANHQVSQALKNKLNNIQGQTNWFNSWEIQNIDNASGPRLNMDLFPTKITSMPYKPGTNQKYTPAEFFDYFRKNINSFIDPDLSQFNPIVDPVYGLNEANLWNSANPLGALVTIAIPGDGGTVMCTGYNGEAWVFTTVKTPIKFDGLHPVSGHRLFGYWVDSNGFMYLFTRGVDRFTKPIPNYTISYLLETIAFSKADDLWKSMQTKITDFVNNPANGGLANKMSPVTYRPAYTKIRNYLKGTATIQSLGCN